MHKKIIFFLTEMLFFNRKVRIIVIARKIKFIIRVAAAVKYLPL